jgi:hypothetical protein
MRIALSFLLAAALVCTAAPSSYAEPLQVIQGTQVRLTLLSGISGAVAKDGDPFVAVVAEPVYLGGQLLLPAGTRVNGVISTVEKARHFSMFRGQAYMNLAFRSIEVDSRLIPVQMSIIIIEQPRGQAEGKRRKDVKIEEGQVVQEKHDVKGDIVGGAIGTGGGTLVGAVFRHVARGFGFGLAAPFTSSRARARTSTFPRRPECSSTWTTPSPFQPPALPAPRSPAAVEVRQKSRSATQGHFSGVPARRLISL